MKITAAGERWAIGSTVKILFVDDEPAIRASLPAILTLHGFEVTSAASVTEALQAINNQDFEVLISDLNIGSPGDGFTVVSAMRRTQPNCVTLILTGYPAFETALQAIRSQVDDYLIKPAGVEKLVTAIEDRLRTRKPHNLSVLKRVPTILMENANQIADELLHNERHILSLPRVHLTDEEFRANVLQFVSVLAEQLETGSPQLMPELINISIQHGIMRSHQGYSASLMVEEHRLFSGAIINCIQNNLLVADVSNLLPDLKAISDVLSSMLREAISAFASTARAA